MVMNQKGEALPMKHLHPNLLGIVCLMIACPVFGQDNSWMPVVADRKVQQVRVAAEGNETVLETLVGEYLRGSDGRTLKTQGPRHADGSAEPTMGMLIDPQEGKFYQLLYSRGRAVERPGKKRAGPQPVTPDRLERALGQEVVNGVPCYGVAIGGGSHSKVEVEVSGVAWKSIQYDFVVKSVSEFTSEGRTTKLVEELTNIRIGEEPEEARLRVPTDYDVVALPPSVGVGAGCGSCARTKNKPQ